MMKSVAGGGEVINESRGAVGSIYVEDGVFSKRSLGPGLQGEGDI